MASYYPPTEILAIFDTSVFNKPNFLTYGSAIALYLTPAQGDARYLRLDGTNMMSSDLNTNNHMISNLSTVLPTNNQAVSFLSGKALFISRDGSNSMLGGLNMNVNQLYNVSALNAPSGYDLLLQIANVNYLQLSTTAATFSKNIKFNYSSSIGIDMNTNRITNLSLPTGPTDATNLLYAMHCIYVKMVREIK